MADSLKDQLLALGLAKSKPEPRAGKKPAQGKGQAARRGPRPGKPRRDVAPPPARDGDISLDAAWTARKREEKQAVDDKVAARRAEDLRRRQVNTEVEALVKDQAQNDAGAELKRNFLYKGRIRSVLVTPPQLQALNAGELGLVFLRGSYLVLPPELVAKVAALSPEHVPDLSGADAGEEDGADYPPVPDDITW
jgi:uncharacterized protein YaiL (DUF2058 family)